MGMFILTYISIITYESLDNLSNVIYLIILLITCKSYNLDFDIALLVNRK